MDTHSLESYSQQLNDRKKGLQSAINRLGQTEELTHLLREVDTALEKIHNGSFGLCETCHDAIEEDRLAVDPLLRNCLDHLTSAEQRLLERDLDLAYQVQTGLLPKQGLNVAGWTSAYHYEPAGAVSGDYLDLLMPDGQADSFHFLIGDVTGKGVAASILMSNLHAIFRSLLRSGAALSPLVQQANALFCQGTTSRYFATLVCGRATRNGEVELLNGGHCPPVIIRQSGVSTVPSNALPLGMFCQSHYTPVKFSLKPGESLVLYTDGLVEARDASDAFYGEDRLLSLLGSSLALPADKLVSRCVQDLNAFRPRAGRLDDVTILALKYNG